MSNTSRPHRAFVIDSSFVIRRLSFLVLAVLVVGCGSQTGPERIAVNGTVKRDGKSVEQGSISFLPVKGHKGPAANRVISGGKYSFSTENGPTAGPHRVLVRIPPPTKGDLAKGKPPGRETGPVKPAGKKGKTLRAGRWEFERTVSEEGRKQDFILP